MPFRPFSGKRGFGFVFLGIVAGIFWVGLPAFRSTFVQRDDTERRVEVFDTTIRGYAQNKLRWYVQAKSVWTGYNPFLFRGEDVGPGMVFDDSGRVVIRDLFSKEVQVNAKTKILYAYDTVSAYFVPSPASGFSGDVFAHDTQGSVKVVAGSLKYVDAVKRTYLTDKVRIVQGDAAIVPHMSAEVDNTTNQMWIEDGFLMTFQDLTVSGNQMQLLIDEGMAHMTQVVLVRQGKPTSDSDLDPRERALRKKTATLTADKMRFRQEGTAYDVYVSGNVTLLHDDKSFVGDEGMYDSRTAQMRLFGNVQIRLSSLTWLLHPDRVNTLRNPDIKTSLGMQTVIVCDAVTFDAQTKQLVLTGHVRVKQLDKELRCDKVVYEDVSQKLILSGHVQVRREGTDSLTASEIVIDLSEESYWASGRIQTEFKIRKLQK